MLIIKKGEKIPQNVNLKKAEFNGIVGIIYFVEGAHANSGYKYPFFMSNNSRLNGAESKGDRKGFKYSYNLENGDNDGKLFYQNNLYIQCTIKRSGLLKLL